MEWLNPQNFVENYEEFFNHIYYGILGGFWPRCVGVVFLILSFWMYFRRRNVLVGAGCFIIAAMSAYGSTLLIIVKRLFNG